MSFHDLVSMTLMNRLGWTLIHSLWQGAAVAVMLGIALIALRRSSSQARYLAATSAMAALALCAIVTFIKLAVPTSTTSFAQTGPLIEIETGHASSFIARTSPTFSRPSAESPIQPHAHRIQSALPWLAIAWIVGVLALSAWRVGGWIAVQRLRVLKILPADPQTMAIAQQLAQLLGLDKPPRIVQSLLAQTPMVIGWLRPMILLPVAVLTELTPQQLEAILAHELAHIRRHDYLMNLLQVLVETLLFYHPAVWWMSRRIRLEREQCCDDIAVGICGDCCQYVESLALLEELRMTGSLGLAARGAGGAQLVARVRRLLAPDENAPRRGMRALAASFVIITLFATALCCRNSKPDASLSSAKPTTKSTDSKVLLVTDGNHFLERLVLHSLDLKDPRQITSAEYERTHPDGFDVVIFDRHEPRWMAAEGKFIYFGCAPETKLKAIKQNGENVIVHDITIKDWERDHPLFQWLNLSKIYAADMLKLQVPAAAQTLARGKNGEPVIVAYREENRTHLVVAFDLMESNWPLSHSFPLFVHQAINWNGDTPVATSPKIPEAAFDPPLTELRGVKLKTPVRPLTLFGMKLIENTPELQQIFDLSEAGGVIILDPGPNIRRLEIGRPREGCRIWMIGNYAVSNLAELVANLQRIALVSPPTEGGEGPEEGWRDSVRIVYAYNPESRGTNTQYLKLTAADRNELFALTGLAGSSRLQFRLVSDAATTAPSHEIVDSDDPDHSRTINVLDEVLLNESAVASADLQSQSDGWQIGLTMTDAGSRQLEEITSQNIGRRLAMFVDGKLLSAPTIRSTIRSKAVIAGGGASGFSREQAEAIASAIAGKPATRASATTEPVVIQVRAPLLKPATAPSSLEITLQNNTHNPMTGALSVFRDDLPIDLDPNKPGVQETRRLMLNPGLTTQHVKVVGLAETASIIKFSATFDPLAGMTRDEVEAAASAGAFAKAPPTDESPYSRALNEAAAMLDESYRLKDGEVLRLIKPPFPKSRSKLIERVPPTSKDKPEDIHCMGLVWKNDKLVGRYTSRSPADFKFIVLNMLGIPWDAIDGINTIKWIPDRGDFIIRDDATDEQKLNAVAKLIEQETGQKFRVGKEKKTRLCVVLHGETTRPGFSDGEGEWRGNHVLIFSQTPITDQDTARWEKDILQWGVGGRPEATFYNLAQAWYHLDAPFYDDGSWHGEFHRTNRGLVMQGLYTPLSHSSPDYEKKIRAILDNIQKQVGGDWRLEPRDIMMWVFQPVTN